MIGSRRWRWLLGFCLAGSVLFGLYVARRGILPPFARWLDVGQPPQRADCAMVLGGAENTRPFVAAALVRAGLARRVLFARTAESPQVADGIVPPSHEVIRRVLRRRGVPDRDIVPLGEKVAHTYGEAQVLAAYLESSPDARVLVVTSDYHTRRARWVFARVLRDRARRVSFVSAPTDEFRADNWWRTEKGFAAIVGEYLKLAFYALWYGQLAYWIAACVALVLVILVYRRRRASRTT